MTKSLSNLLRRGTIVNKDERVIDYNDIISKKLEALSESYEERQDDDGFINGLDAEEIYDEDEDLDLDALLADDEELAQLTEKLDEDIIRLDEMEAAGFGDDVSDEEIEAITQTRQKRRKELMQQKEDIINEALANRPVKSVSKPKKQKKIHEENIEDLNVKSSQIIEEANATASQIIEEANNTANDILEEARNNADAMRRDAMEDGYNIGTKKAKEETDELKKTLESEYQEKLSQLEAEYEEKKANIEPELVDILTDVFKKVTLTVADDNQEIIMHLINQVMRNAENSHNFIIKVSPDDYKFLINNQGKLYVAMSKEVNIDILEDPTMNRNECIIETDTGVFNCGLDIELDNLIKDLKLLSCI